MERMKQQNQIGISLSAAQKFISGYNRQPDSNVNADMKPPIPNFSNMPGTGTQHQIPVNVVLSNAQHPQAYLMGNSVQFEGQRGIMIGNTRYPVPNNPVMNNHFIQTQQSLAVGGQLPNNSKPGSNYSSPRSSVGSAGDSKGSSPGSSLINPPPPPPYDPRMLNQRNSIASNRSSISITSLDSKHSSPRTSLAGVGGLIIDKFPSSRTSLVNPQDSQSSVHHQLNINQLHASLTSLGSTGVLNDSRFNEHAPPQLHSITDPRLRVVPPQTTASVNGHVFYPTNNMNSFEMNGFTSAVSNPSSNFQQRNIAQISPPPALPARVPINNTQQRPSSQSETERNIALLTQKLTDDMRISMSPQPTSSGPPTPPPKEPPPPYHGPHKTEPMPGLPPRNVPVKFTNNTSGLTSQTVPVTPFGPNVSLNQVPPKTPPSATVRPQAQISYQVTPPQPKGPSEAEKKLMALTQELEDELESKAQAEYFGKHSHVHVGLLCKKYFYTVTL